MHDSHRYHYNAAGCLLAARQASEPHYRELILSMAATWISFSRQDETIDDLLASWNMPSPPKLPG